MQSRFSRILAIIRYMPGFPRFLAIGIISTLATAVIVGVLSTILGLMHSLLTDFSLLFAVPLIFVIGLAIGKHRKGGLSSSMAGILAIILAFAAVWAMSWLTQFARGLVEIRIPIFIISMTAVTAAVHGEDIKKLTEDSEQAPKRNKG